MDPADFADFQKNASKALIKLIKNTKVLSSGDLAFNKSLDAEFATALDKVNSKILGMINDVVRNATHGSDIKFESFEDADSVEARWSAVSEVVDFLLEKADLCMDEYTGTVNRGVMQTTAAASNYKSTRSDRRTAEGRKAFNKSLHMAKPQLQFKKPLSPLEQGPYKPRLTRKPHAIIPLEESLVPTIVEGREKYPHPYLEEISRYTFPEEVRKQSDPIQYRPFESTSAIWVDTPETLNDMKEQLLKASEIAVDLEHHDYRSYIGLVCLMQISTRDQDWIVDTLKLRDELEVLNEVFTDPKIIKVFHGAFMDMIWLQRDLNLYVVGLFDTYDAARSLGFAGHSLAFLLKKYINFDADKSYQLADWRVRPIPQDMLDYARSDTHFLLYVYDNMRNELIEKSTVDENKIEVVLQNSKETSMKTYDNEPYDSMRGGGSRGWLSILKHNAIDFTDEQFTVFKAVHAWRDKVAREEDDSPNFIMSKNHLLGFARQMPADTSTALSISNNPHIRARLVDLLSVIQQAKSNPDSFKAIHHLLGTTGKYWEPKAKGGDQPAGEVKIEPMLGAEDAKAKTEESQFWGVTFGGSRWQVKDLVNGVNDISLALPLPNITATIFDHQGTEALATPLPRAEYIKDREMKTEEPDIIVVKQLGRSRKRKNRDFAEDTADAGVNEVPYSSSPLGTAPTSGNETGREEGEDGEEGEGVTELTRSDRRAAKKAEKKRKKEEAKKNQQATADAITNNQDFQPFDYSAAPTVLNAKKEEDANVFHGNKKYNDGPRGMRARKREREGKSKSFATRG
ncbi:exosome nuclease subunit [Orbilia brochopaga]|uniref:Exosome nuclease subunit n=1 Tax=Orbilia brochopaga TaxID=3140254 RepID=A0AAV9VFS7_9PEZI